MTIVASVGVPPRRCKRCQAIMRPGTLSSFCQRNPECKHLCNREQYLRAAAAREAADPQPLCQCCGFPMRRNTRVPICSRSRRCRSARKQWYYEHVPGFRAASLARHALWYAANRERTRVWRRRYYVASAALYHANGLTVSGRPYKRPPHTPPARRSA